MSKNNLFPSTAYTARRTALKPHQLEIDAIIPLVTEAAAKGKFSITVPRLHEAVKELLETEHELIVKIVADYDTKLVTLNHKISW